MSGDEGTDRESQSIYDSSVGSNYKRNGENNLLPPIPGTGGFRGKKRRK